MLEPFEVVDIPIESAEDAYENVLRFGGARLPKRDALAALAMPAPHGKHPELSISTENGQITVEWDADFAGFRLDNTTAPGEEAWSEVEGSMDTTSVTIPEGDKPLFFRLTRS